MIITQKKEEKTFPYLSIFNFGDPLKIEDDYEVSNIMLLSLITKHPNDEKQIYAQHINGERPGWFIQDEKDYTPLPKKIEITFKQ